MPTADYEVGMNISSTLAAL